MLRKTRRYLLAHIPLMVRSKYCSLYGFNSLQLQHLGECRNDTGGYFIVNGSEKVMVLQEKMATNNIFIFKDNRTGNFKAEIRSTSDLKLIVPSQIVITLVKPSGKFKQILVNVFVLR